jgi:hypothetical protein
MDTIFAVKGSLASKAAVRDGESRAEDTVNMRMRTGWNSITTRLSLMRPMLPSRWRPVSNFLRSQLGLPDRMIARRPQVRSSVRVATALAQSSRGHSALTLLILVFATVYPPSSTALTGSSIDERSGTSGLHTEREIYQAACVACDGPVGAGVPQSLTGFEKPATFPDFTQPDQTSPEYWRDWKAVIRDGGPARGFSQIMPAFGDVFTPEQIDQHGHRLRYSVDVASAAGPFQAEAERWYQPIGFRWASNLKRYNTSEPRRLNSYFDSMSAASAVAPARSCAPVPCRDDRNVSSPKRSLEDTSP